MGLLNPVFFLFSSLVFPLAGGAVQARLTPDQIRPLIPRTFPEGDSRDLSPYTVRYLSTDNSSEDSPACLGNQLRNDSTRVDCHTLRYSLGRVDDPVTNEESHIFNSSYLILVVFPGEYPYSVSSNRNLEVRNFTNIIIARHPYPQTQRHGDGKVIFKCQSLDDENFNNFYVREVTNIAFTGITFAHCGERSTGLTIRVGRNVIVESCTFTDNSGGGVVIKESKEIFILNSVFKDNLVNSPYRYFSDLTVDNRKGAGLTLFFIGGEGPGYTLIKNCTFENNLAGLNQSNEEDAKTRPILYIPRGHGGSLLLSFQNTEEHRVNITNCTFRNGFAHFAGGAIAVQFYRGAANTEVVQRSSHGNLVSISKSMFVNNTCQEDGGAISVSAFETANRNKVEVRQSLFSDNWAGGNGGAFSHVIEDNIVTRENASLDNTAVIQTSNFTCNFAQRGGGAISLTTNARSDQATEVFNISDCNFTGNSGKGAVLSLRYPVSLQGSNNFTENNGGAIILFGAPLTITGQALFQANTAWVGAAIEMLDYSTVDIQSGANVMFWGNRAMRKGGAIMVVELILTGDVYASTIRRNSQSCFILLPGNSSSSDRVNISFIDNSAGEAGGAIYTTDLSICLQKNVSTEDKVDYMKDTIFEDEQFLFRNNTVLGDQMQKLATEPSSFQVEPLASSLHVTPGEELRMKISVADQLGNKQEAIWATNFKEGIYSVNQNGSLFSHPFKLTDESLKSSYERKCAASYKDEQLTALSDDPMQLDFILIREYTGEMANVYSLDVIMTCCNPGYTLVDDMCVMDESLSDLFLKDDSTREYFYIKPQFYAEVRNGSVIWASVPPYFLDCTHPGNLSGCLFKYDEPEDQCDNRTGFLCGKCPNEMYIDLTFSACVKCEGWHGGLLAVLILAFAAVCALVMIFNIGIHSEARGFLFYIQVVGFVYQNEISWTTQLANIFGYTLYIPALCAYPGYDALQTVALGYTLPLTAIIVIIIYIISARFVKRLSNKNSFDGIWLLSFIVFKFAADASFDILRCEKVHGLQNETRYVYYYDGEFQCFTTEDLTHLGFAVAAIFVTALTFLFMIFIFVVSFKRFRLTVNITDVLNKDLKDSCRWWASFDLFRRLLFIWVVAFSGSGSTHTQLVLLYSGLFVFFVFACAQPYTSKVANIFEALMLLDLLLVSALYLDSDPGASQGAVDAAALFLLLLPFSVALIYLSFMIVSYYWVKFSPSTLKAMFVGWLCKIVRRMGMKPPKFMLRIECTRFHLPTTPTETLPASAEDNTFDSTAYMQYREELLSDD